MSRSDRSELFPTTLFELNATKSDRDTHHHEGRHPERYTNPRLRFGRPLQNSNVASTEVPQTRSSYRSNCVQSRQ